MIDWFSRPWHRSKKKKRKKKEERNVSRINGHKHKERLLGAARRRLCGRMDTAYHIEIEMRWIASKKTQYRFPMQFPWTIDIRKMELWLVNIKKWFHRIPLRCEINCKLLLFNIIILSAPETNLSLSPKTCLSTITRKIATSLFSPEIGVTDFLNRVFQKTK